MCSVIIFILSCHSRALSVLLPVSTALLTNQSATYTCEWSKLHLLTLVALNVWKTLQFQLYTSLFFTKIT